MACVPSRGRPCPSVDIGCNYKATYSGNSVIIAPKIANAKCNITVGLGNATFTFDPLNPPDTIVRIITKDAIGSYAPPSLYDYNRGTKTFSSAVDANETFKDADGNITELNYKKLNDYARKSTLNGMRYAMGTKTVGNNGQKTM